MRPIGLWLDSWTTEVREKLVALHPGAVVLTEGAWKAAEEINSLVPDIAMIYRDTYDDEGGDPFINLRITKYPHSSGVYRARHMLRHLLELPQGYIHDFNEPPCKSQEELDKLTIASEAFRQEITRNSNWPVIQFNTGTASLPLGWQPPKNIALGLHHYWLTNQGDIEWTALHYRKLGLTTSQPLIFTEAGIDKEGVGGWQAQDWSLERYIETMRRISKEWANDGVTGCIFGEGFRDWGRWKSFSAPLEFYQAMGEANNELKVIDVVVEERKVMNYIALCPSLQDRNISNIPEYSKYNEAGNMVFLAQMIAERAKALPNLEVQVMLPGWFESDDEAGSTFNEGRLSGLRKQMKMADNYLNSKPSGSKYVISLHTDSGEDGHTFGIYGLDTIGYKSGGERTKVSKVLATTIATQVASVFGRKPAIFWQLGEVDYSEYVFWKNTSYPSVLIELCSHQNKKDLDILYSNIDKVAMAVIVGASPSDGELQEPAYKVELLQIVASLQIAMNKLSDVIARLTDT